ncbi:MAG: prepilin-type N-terminal cleavage/methylation domain-containing protein [Candidatus Ozemobacteraceae bacterium]
MISNTNHTVFVRSWGRPAGSPPRRHFEHPFNEWYKRMKISGFTLVEVLISAALLAMFMSGVMLSFKGGSDSFNTGNWRIQSQKKAQIFLVRLKENLGKANYAVQILSGGNSAGRQNMPLFINKRWHNVEADCKTSAAVMWFSITKPYMEAQTSLNLPESRGKWSGISLYCQNRVLTLRRTGNITTLNAPFGAPISIPAGPFDPDGVQASFEEKLPDVELMQINHKQNVDGTSVEVILKMRRYINNKPQEVWIKESILCKLLLPDHTITEF